MRFAQKLICVMLLVTTAAFSLGGSALLLGIFQDNLNTAALQEEGRHNMVCRALETEMLNLHTVGESVSDGAMEAALNRAVAPEDAALLLHDEAVVAQINGSDWAFGRLPVSGSSIINRTDAGIYRVYRTDLLGDYALISGFSLDDLFAARTRNLQRFLLLEAAVLVGAGIVVAFVSRSLTRPLAALTRTSAQIAAGDYARRTGVNTADEIGDLARSFDRMSAAIQEKVDALELSVRQRDDFMGAFTHELKTPMTAILGYADTLRTMQVDPEEQRQAAAAIYHEARRLEALGGKLLQLLHLADEPLELVPVPLQAVFDRAARAAKGSLGGCLLDVAPTEARVEGDADLLVDLVLNLITNAARASEAGQSIRVEAEKTGEGVQVRVADQGRGIPPDQLDRITEPFYMVDKSRARKQGGSGLGLALGAAIAQAHGTRLQFESTPGQGTTVRFTLKEVA